MPGIFGFYIANLATFEYPAEIPIMTSIINVKRAIPDGAPDHTFVIVHGLEDSLWLPQQTRHLPDRHLKVHLREFEQPLEKTRHSQARTPVSAITRRTSVLSRDGNMGIHLPEVWRTSQI